jgi:hypothetical protein
VSTLLNVTDPVPSSDLLKVIDYADPQVARDMASGKMNTDEVRVLANIAAAVRRGHPQWRGGPPRPERICLVGSGPSLNDTEDELRRAVWEGAALVTMNGAYHWCIERGLKPQTQIVMDARASNARFLEPAVPKCNYILASQCDPACWDVVEGRDHVWIFHAVVKKEGAASEYLDTYYAGQWVGIAGGTTVATRAIGLLRTAGYLRFDLFGIDCCWFGDVHHALPQPENAHDRWVLVQAGVRDKPETMRTFRVTHWQLKQAEDLLTIMNVNGRHFALTAHGDGMFAHLLRSLGSDDLDSLTLTTQE